MSDQTPPPDAAQNDQPTNPAQPVGPPHPEESLVIVRYGLMRHIGQFTHNLESPPIPGTKVVIRTERGVELGEVIIPLLEEPVRMAISPTRLEQFLESNGPGYPFTRQGKVLRIANPQDLIDQKHLESSAREEQTYCRQQIRELGLEMKLICVEHLLGGERIVFYFTSEQRVDFRELVRRLASQYRTRIEMRQVGARDEARLVGDYERCGLRCCCQQFLKDLKPVSMRMAKIQKATLDPTKISGRCGRLMCCLRYEDETYAELKSKLPGKNTWVRTAELVGKVTETQILTQLVKLSLPDGSVVVVPNEDIVQRDIQPPETLEEAQALLARLRAEAEAKSQAEALARAGKQAPQDVQPPHSPQADETQPPESADSKQARKKKRKRRRRRRPKDKPKAPTPDTQQAAEPKQDQSTSQERNKAASKSKKTRRRRRRRRKTKT